MSTRPYSLEAWRNFQGRGGRRAETSLPPTLADIPADAEMDEGIVLGCWNGERFVSWEKWRATSPIERDAPAEPACLISRDAPCVTATCGSTRVWLVRDGDRWLMFAGTRSSRRRDFASPFLNHAQRTAEAWYDLAEKGWHVGVQG
jgi:hypothetical protein